MSSPPYIWLVRWLLFFFVCLSLGYAAVQRYNPQRTEGLSDAAVYYRIVAGERVEARELRFRLLVPLVARAIRPITSQAANPPGSIYLALLIANALFCATAACIIVAIGLKLLEDLATSMFAAALFLLNFAITNLFLTGLVDSGEACLFLALTLILFTRRLWLLPLCGVVGSLAKETYLPIAGAFALIWWLVACRKSPERWQKLLPVVAGIAAMALTILTVRSIFATSLDTSAILVPTHAGGGRLAVVTSPTIWYVFIWLLPLGIPRLTRLPRPWVFASFATATLVLVLGWYRAIGGNVARPLFTVLGPLLSLSAAMWLTDVAVSARTRVS